ncbi:hypothetical protein GQ457_07G011240 [Hibiscus cannabinus]
MYFAFPPKTSDTVNATIPNPSMLLFNNSGGLQPGVGAPKMVSTPLERHASPIYVEDQRVTKKTKDFEINPVDVVMAPDLMEGVVGDKGSIEILSDVEGHALPRGFVIAIGMANEGKSSYVAMDFRSTTAAGQHTIAMVTYGIEVSENDYTVDRSGSFSRIKFSEKVHESIDRSMQKVVVFRLLGR